MTGRWGAILTGLAMTGLAGINAGAAGDPLGAHRWNTRVLLVIASDAHDPKLARQREIFRAMQAGARDRDLTLVEAVGENPQADTLRKRFDVADRHFRAILVGKDGGDKLASDEPLGAEQLFPLIDAMPMRQQEKRRGS